MGNYFSKRFDNSPDPEELKDQPTQKMEFNLSDETIDFINQESARMGISKNEVLVKILDLVMENSNIDLFLDYIEKGIKEGKTEGKIPPGPRPKFTSTPGKKKK